MPSFGKLLFAFLVLSVFFWIIESLFAANKQPRWRKDSKTDLIYWFITPMVSKQITKIALAVMLVIVFRQDLETLKTTLMHRDTPLARQPLWLQGIEIIIVGDFVAYWMHRAFHRGRLWPFHAVHHCSPQLDWLSSVRLHPVNDLVMRLAQVLVILLLGFSPIAAATYVPFLTFYAIMLHANVNWTFGRLGKVVASPVFHRWHHTSEQEGLDKNFAGLLPVYDMLFGTYYMPQGKLPERFGLDNETMPESFLGQMVYPFRKSATRRSL